MIRVILLALNSLLALTPNSIIPKAIQDPTKLDPNNFYISEKLDGVRAIWDGKALRSKNGSSFEAPAFFIQDLPSFSIDGELYSRDLAFEDIVSIIKSSKDKHNWDKLNFNIFDVYQTNPINEDLKIRLNKLKPYLEKNKYLKIIPQHEFKTTKEVKDFIAQIQKQNGEGVIFREKIGSGAYKYKFFQDAECVVLEILEGEGKYKGKMGSLLCQDVVHSNKVSNNKDAIKGTTLKNGYKTLPQIFKIGSGFSDAQRDNPPKVGDIITYKYYSRTKKNLPRYPVFLRLRELD